MPITNKTLSAVDDELVLHILIGIAGLVWAVLLIGNAYLKPFSSTLIDFIVILETSLIAIGLLWRRSPQLARYAFVLAMTGFSGGAFLAFHSAAFLYICSAQIILSMLLLRSYFALANLLITSAFTVTVGSIFSTPENVLGACFLQWTVSIIIWLFVRSYRQSSINDFVHQAYIGEQIRNARDQRAELSLLNKQLSQSQEHLSYMNLQLISMRNVAQEAQKLKARFAANVSHELRTPINLIIGFSEVIAFGQEVYHSPLPREYLADFHAIHRNAMHLRSLINDILDISQMEAAHLAIVGEEISPEDVILEATDLIREMVIKKGLAFNIVLPTQPLPSIWMDRTRIRQVLLNLIANAIRFTDKGSITATAELEADEYLKVSIKDTGQGISTGELAHIFEEFYKSNTTEMQEQNSTGLGLTLSKQLIHLHGGNMTAESAGIPGQGSTFSFTLPILDNRRLQLYSSPEATRTLPGPNCVVVFDEDKAVSYLFKRYIMRHQVVCVQSIDDALKLVREVKPFAFVVDGRYVDQAFSKQIHQFSPGTMIIQCSMPSGRRMVQAYGATEYLVKPVSRESLHNVVEGLGKPVTSFLIIDKNRDVVRMFQGMLRSISDQYRIFQAFDTNQGSVVIRSKHPDVVIMDFPAPDTEGMTIIEQLRNDPALKEIAVVFVSARGANDAIASTASGEIIVSRKDEFKATELVNYINALLSEMLHEHDGASH